VRRLDDCEDAERVFVVIPARSATVDKVIEALKPYRSAR
jgi:hypothetical protein